MISGALANHPQVYSRSAKQANSGKRDMVYGNRPFQLFDELSERAREDLSGFLRKLGITTEKQMIVIPASRHFFYDAEDLKGISTIVNLRQLNHIREVRNFLRTIVQLLSDNGNFVGCFTDSRIHKEFSHGYQNQQGLRDVKEVAYENGIESRIPFINRMYSLIDARTNRNLTKRRVTSLLLECGLKLIGMNEINGMTYFYTRKNITAA
jgi:hypothetical protein